MQLLQKEVNWEKSEILQKILQQSMTMGSVRKNMSKFNIKRLFRSLWPVSDSAYF